MNQVAGITHNRRLDMRSGLTAGQVAVVAIETVANGLTVIHCARRDRHPGGRELLVAGITGIRCRYVQIALARCGGTVVTTYTVTRECRVVYRGNRCPGRGGMALITLQRGRNMRSALARGNGAVMTTAAGTHHLRMVHG